MTKTVKHLDGTVLLIGGGGFLGTNLTDSLVKDGTQVINYSRSWLQKLESPLVQYATAREDDPDQLARLVSQSSYVFHMAHGSSPTSSMQYMEEDLISSIRLSFTLMRYCEENDIPLIYLSSGGAVYGRVHDIPTAETAPTLPISAYGAAKLTTERYLAIHAEHRNLKCRILRISNPFGPWQLGHSGQGVIGTWMNNIRTNKAIEIWGDGSVVRDYIFVSDVVDSMIRVAKYQGPEPIFNIGAGTGLSLNDIFQELQTLCGYTLRCDYRPAAPADVPISILDIQLATEHLELSPPTSFAAGLRQTWDWMQSYHQPGNDSC